MLQKTSIFPLKELSNCLWKWFNKYARAWGNRKTYSILLISASLQIHCIKGKAQDALGIAGSSRAPVNTAYFNPASICDSRAFLDIELAGLDAFIQNNLLYIPKEQYSPRNFSNIGDPGINKRPKTYYAKAQTHIRGPSFVANFKQHAVGIQTGASILFDARKLPNPFNFILTNDIDIQPQFGTNEVARNMKISAMAYGYVGLSYATIYRRWDKSILQLGANVRRLFSPGAGSFRVDRWNYVLRADSSLFTSDIKGEAGISIPGEKIISGKGWGIDLGATWKVRSKGSEHYTPWNPCTDGDYLYKISLALLDVGGLWFKKPYYRYEFDVSSGSVFNNDPNVDWSNPDSASAALSSLGITEKNKRKKIFFHLPTALSGQFDYKVIDRVYVMGALTWGFPRNNSLGIQRASYCAIVPRWESKIVELSLPLTFYEFKKPMLGVGIRIFNFIIGSDYLSPLLFNGDLYGSHIYCHLKICLFKHPGCSDKKQHRKHATPPPCEDFK